MIRKQRQALPFCVEFKRRFPNEFRFENQIKFHNWFRSKLNKIHTHIRCKVGTQNKKRKCHDS